MLGTPLTFNAGTVNVQATGQQGSISVAYDGQTAQQPSLISTGGKVTLNADNSTGNAGNISISADAINITSAFSIHANALASGNGGSIDVTTAGGDLSAQGGTGSFVISANGIGSGMTGGTVNLSSAGAITAKGGSIDVTPSDGSGGTITAVAATTLNLTGIFDASGKGLGTGGNLTLVQSSASPLDLSRATLQAEGGPPASGDNVDITYSSASPLKVKTISAINSNGATGGTIHVTNGASGDMTVFASGTIDTNAAGALAGSITLTPFDPQNNNITLEIASTGNFNSILSATGKSVNFSAVPQVILGLAAVTATNGDINICATGTGSCMVAALADLGVRANQQAPVQGRVEVTNDQQVQVNGNMVISTPVFTLDTGGGTHYTGVDAFKSTTVNTDVMNFGTGSFLDGGGSQNLTIKSLSATTLQINVAGGSTTGFKNASGSTIDAGSVAALNIAAIGSGTAVLQLTGITGINGGQLLSGGGAITTGANVQVTSNSELNIQSNQGTVTLGGDVKTTNNTGSEIVTVSAGGNLTQTGGQISTSGNLTLMSTNGNIGTSSTQPIQVSAPNLTLNTGASGGSVFAAQAGNTPVNLGNSSAGTATSVHGDLNFTSGGPLTLVAGNDITAGGAMNLKADSITVPSRSVSTGNGSLTLNAVTGPININGASPTIQSRGGDIIIQLGSIASNPYPNDPLAAHPEIVVPGGAGSVFWGQAPGITLNGSNSVNPLVHNVSFDTKGIPNGIVLNGLVTILAQ